MSRGPHVLLVGPAPPAVEEAVRALAAAGRLVPLAPPPPVTPDLVLGEAGRLGGWLSGPGLHHVPVLVWGPPADALAALDAGADAWLDAAEPPAHLAARLVAVLRRLARPAPGGRMDTATGLMARPMFEDLLQHEYDRAVRYRRPLGLLVVAPDFAPGEAAVAAAVDRAVASLLARLRTGIREVDTLARVAPDTLALLLPETDVGGARSAAQRLRDLGRSAVVPAGATAAFGIAAAPFRGIDRARDLFGRALEALRQARRAGGDRVVAFGATDIVWSREAPDPDAP